MRSDKEAILLLTDWYEPGFKAGGPIRSCRNLIDAFANEYRFFVLTSDRDLGDTQPYKQVKSDEWLDVATHVKVYYASPGTITGSRLLAFCEEIKPVAVYLNSMFSPEFTLKPLWTLYKSGFSGRIVLAPRGMLKLSALAQKSVKKKIFLQLAALAGLEKRVIFHATDLLEENEIKKQFGEKSIVVVAPNLPGKPGTFRWRKKSPGELKIVFLSRIHPIKNLLFALDMLEKTPAAGNRIVFDIYGAISDDDYYSRCFEAARRLEHRVSVQFFGQVDHAEVADILSQYHLFLLPTRGENFGHAIFEALAAGCPALISDQTPWNDLEKHHAGWAISLDLQDKFLSIIQLLYNMEQAEFDKWSAGAYQYAANYPMQYDLRGSYHQLFTGKPQP